MHTTFRFDFHRFSVKCRFPFPILHFTPQNHQDQFLKKILKKKKKKKKQDKTKQKKTKQNKTKTKTKTKTKNKQKKKQFQVFKIAKFEFS